jgi:hypothetical protein
MHKLPTEIILYIFEFLEPEDVARISSVCKNWNALANYSPIWRKFCQNLKISKMSTNEYELYKNDWKRMYKDNRKIEATYLWYIPNFTNLNEKKYYSEEFLSFNYKWRLLLFPRGNTDRTHLAFYLESLEGIPDMYTYCTLSINKWDGISINQDISHVFSPMENDWGFNQCLKLQHIYDTEKSYIKNNILRVSCYIKMCHN